MQKTTKAQLALELAAIRRRNDELSNEEERPVWTPEIEDSFGFEIAERDAVLRSKQAQSAAYLAQIDAEVQVTIAQEVAADDGVRSEQCTIAFL